MTKLAHRLGLCRQLEFQDVLSVTDEDLLAMVPRPVHALLWLFPITGSSEYALEEEEDGMDQYEAAGSTEPVLWFHQTIGNACGLIGLLHCVTNGPAAQHVTPGSELARLVRAATPAQPKERAQQLYDSDVLEMVHRAAAEEGDSDVPAAEDRVSYGFTAFVRGKDGHLWELEGRRKGPVDRGVVHPDEDLLSERCLGLSLFPYINREKVNETRFSCIALVNAESHTKELT
jgi:ubiquitin carboxyl-terminal hydrolase L3